MVMPVTQLLPDEGAAVYYSEGWMLMVETHLNWLKRRDDNELIPVTPSMAYKYEGDFYGLLSELRVAPIYWWLLMRMNGMMAPTDFRSENVVSLLKPTFSNINQLTDVYQTTMSKIK